MGFMVNDLRMNEEFPSKPTVSEFKPSYPVCNDSIGRVATNILLGDTQTGGMNECHFKKNTKVSLKSNK